MVHNDTVNVRYPTDFQLPKWPLKKLVLSVAYWKKIGFLPALLKNCSALVSLEAISTCSWLCVPAEAASLITSEPFTQLEELNLNLSYEGASVGNIFIAKEWPALKQLTANTSILPEIASKIWLKI